MATVRDDCSEVISLIRGAARTPLHGMTPSEIEARTRLNRSTIRSCIDSLLASRQVARAGKRNGEEVYGLPGEG